MTEEALYINKEEYDTPLSLAKKNLTIYKYPIYIPSTDCEIEMPKDAVILSCGLDARGVMCIWAMVDPNVELEVRHIYCIGTGWSVDELADEATQFVGTVRDGEWIWHIFAS